MSDEALREAERRLLAQPATARRHELARELERAGRIAEALRLLFEEGGAADPLLRELEARLPGWTLPEGDAGGTRWLDIPPPAGTPRTAWTSDVGHETTALVATLGGVVVGGPGGLTVLDALGGAVRWTLPDYELLGIHRGLVVASRPTPDDDLAAFDLFDGTRRWTAELKFERPLCLLDRGVATLSVGRGSALALLVRTLDDAPPRRVRGLPRGKVQVQGVRAAGDRIAAIRDGKAEVYRAGELERSIGGAHRALAGDASGWALETERGLHLAAPDFAELRQVHGVEPGLAVMSPRWIVTGPYGYVVDDPRADLIDRATLASRALPGIEPLAGAGDWVVGPDPEFPRLLGRDLRRAGSGWSVDLPAGGPYRVALGWGPRVFVTVGYQVVCLELSP